MAKKREEKSAVKVAKIGALQAVVVSLIALCGVLAGYLFQMSGKSDLKPLEGTWSCKVKYPKFLDSRDGNWIAEGKASVTWNTNAEKGHENYIMYLGAGVRNLESTTPEKVVVVYYIEVSIPSDTEGVPLATELPFSYITMLGTSDNVAASDHHFTFELRPTEKDSRTFKLKYESNNTSGVATFTRNT